MLQLLIDQDIDQDILRGLMRRVPELDAVTAYDIGKSEAPDPELLAWAAEAGRVLVTHDRRTMPAHAARRLAEGDDIAGLSSSRAEYQSVQRLMSLRLLFYAVNLRNGRISFGIFLCRSVPSRTTAHQY